MMYHTPSDEMGDKSKLTTIPAVSIPLPLPSLTMSGNKKVQKRSKSAELFGKNNILLQEPSTSKMESSKRIFSRSPSCQRTLRSRVKQVPTYTKRTKEIQEKSCDDFVKKCKNKELLMQMVFNKMEGKEILEAYKDSRTKQEVKEEASTVFRLDSMKYCPDSEKMSSLQKILVELGDKYTDDDFIEAMLKTEKNQLDVVKVMQHLNPDKLKVAIMKKFTPNELLDLFFKSDNTVVSQKILETASVETIVNQVCSRKDLHESKFLLNLVLEKFSQKMPEVSNSDVDNTAQSNLASVITNVVMSRQNLKSSESLFNAVLQDGTDVITDEVKNNMKELICNKLCGYEFNDLLFEINKIRESQ